MFKKVIILLIAVVCVSSGAFAIISNYGLENTNDSANNSLMNDIKDISSSSESFLNNIKNNNIMDDFKDYWQYTFGYLVNVDGELRHYINDNSAYYLESEGILDRYIQCVDCGGFIPIGEITNPLPKAAICHHNDMDGFSNFSEAIKHSYSRDEAYNMWVEEGKPVCDDEHFNTYPSPPKIDTIYCENCHGILILKNYTDSLFDYYFNIGEASITFIPNQLCSHYNGSLNLFDTPIENFYSGWFKSIDDYNQFMYKAIHSLNDNSTSLENKTLNDISLEKWNHIYDVPENFSYVEYKSLNNNISDNPTVIPDVNYEPVYVPEQNILENTSIE